MSNCISITLRDIIRYHFSIVICYLHLYERDIFLFIAIFLVVHFCIVSPEYGFFHGLRNVAKFVGNFYWQ